MLEILHKIDVIIIVSYLLILFILGVVTSRFAGTFDDFSKVDKSLRKNRLILAATVFATAVGGGTTFGLSEKIFSENLSYAYALILTIPIDLLIAYIVVPRIAFFREAFSAGDVIETAYGKLGRVLTGIAVIISSIGYLAVQISVSGHILHNVLKIDYIIAVIVSYSVVIIYTSSGGLRSVITNNALQFITMIIAIPILTFYGINELGFTEFVNNIPENKYSLSNDKVLWDTIWLTLSFSIMGCYPTLIQRALLNRNAKYMKTAIVIKSAIYFFFILCIALNGLIAFELTPEISGNDSVINMIATILPNGLKGLVIIGFLSSAMSTADTDINVASLSASQDILTPLFRISDQKLLLNITRISSILIGVFSIIVSISFDSIVDIVLTVAGIWAPMMLIPFLSVIFHKTISQKGLVLSIISGIIALLLWQYYYSSCCMLKSIFVGTMANGLVFLIYYFIEYGRGRRR